MTPSSPGAHDRLRAVALIASALASCSDLPSVRQGTCGNGALDPGEDCDFFDGIGVPANQACGSPGSRETACHWLCGDNATCPPAWGCGHDGVCRYADGQFGAVMTITSTPYASLEVGDVDGDAWPDLVGASGRREVDILYGGPQGFSSVDRLPSSPAGVLDLADLNQDGGRDVITSFGGGILVGLGDGDRSVATVLFPTLELEAPPKRLFALDVDGTGTTVVIEDDGASIRVGLDGGAPAASVAVPLGFADLVVPPARADVDDDGDEDLVLTAAGGPATYLLKTQASATPAFAVVSLTVDPSLAGPVPTPASGRRSLHLADVDGDGALDLVGESIGGSGTPVPVVARGLGAGAFETLAPDPRFVGTPPSCASGAGVPLSAEVLEVADLDGDDLGDYVLSDGVYLAHDDGAPRLCQVVRPAGTAGWTDAVVVDLNRDGDLDVVAASETQTLDVLLGDGAGAFSQRTVTAIAPAAFLRAGDFDGDRVDDVAFVEADGVSILFGAIQGTPEPVAMGAVGTVSSFAPLRIADAGGEVDAVSDLLVQWTNGGGIDRVGYLFGTTSRRMIAPLPVAELVSGTVAAHFDDDATTDVVVVARDVASAPALRLFRGDGAGGLELVGAGIPDCADLALADDPILDHGDLVAGAAEELVSLARLPEEAAPIHIVGLAAGEAGALSYTCTAVLPPAGARFEAFEVADLDGNGVLDLLTVITGPEGRAIVALWNEGNRTFTPSAALAIEVSAPLGTVVTSVQADLDPARELVYLGSDHTLYRVQAADRTLEAPVGVLSIPGDLGSMRAADVDGDGLEDLVGSGVGGTVVVPAVAHIGRGLP